MSVMKNVRLSTFSISFACLSLAIPAHAGSDLRSKTDEVSLYRTEALEPPPLAVLPKGVTLQLLSAGASHSLVQTESGMQGWMRNQDLVEVKAAPGGNIKLTEQRVKGAEEFNHSWWLDHAQPEPAEIIPINRSFSGEIKQTLDREQLEMQFDEN